MRILSLISWLLLGGMICLRVNPLGEPEPAGMAKGPAEGTQMASLTVARPVARMQRDEEQRMRSPPTRQED
jgi:hypothetical protein